jgi:hypothetical protein
MRTATTYRMTISRNAAITEAQVGTVYNGRAVQRFQAAKAHAATFISGALVPPFVFFLSICPAKALRPSKIGRVAMMNALVELDIALIILVCGLLLWLIDHPVARIAIIVVAISSLIISVLLSLVAGWAAASQIE